MKSTYEVVTVYTQPDCLPCKRVIAKLEAAGIPLEIVDLTRDMLAKDYVTRVLQATSVPIVEAYGFEVIAGYQPEKLHQFIAEWNLSDIHDYVWEPDD